MYCDVWIRWLRRLADRLHGKSRPHTFIKSRLDLELLEARLTPSAQIDSGGAQGEYNSSDDLNYHGGALIDNVQVEPIFLKDSTTGRTSAYQGLMDGFFNTMTSNAFITSQLSSLSTGAYTIGLGAKGQDDVNVPVTTDTTASGYPSISDANIQNIIVQQIAAAKTAPTTNNTLYFVFTPPGDAVGDDVDGSSISEFLGYHDDFINPTTGVETYYAVIPDPGAPNDTNDALTLPIDQGGWGFTDGQELTAVSSHELAESITDPGTPAAYYNTPLGFSGEVGDLAAGQTYTLDGYMTQYMWENALTGPGHATPTSGNTSQVFIDQLTPPAVSGEASFPVATFTDLNPGDNLSNLSAEVDAIYPNTNDNVWNATITGGANGVYVVNATPAPAVGNGQYGIAAPTNYGLDIIISDNGTTYTTRQVPFTVATSAAFTYNAENSGFAHNFRLVENGTMLDLFDNNQLVFEQPISQTTNVAINADTGTDSSLTIDYSGGNFSTIHSITFDGGNGSGTHTLAVENGSFSNDTYTPTSANAGTLTLDGQTITFTDTSNVDDLVTANNYTVSGTAGVDQINVVNGPSVNNTTTTEINSGNNTFARVDFANKGTVTIKGSTGADVYTVNNPNPANGLAILKLTAGSTAGVVFNIQATAGSVTTDVLGGGANVTANVGTAHSVQGIIGTLNLDDTAVGQLNVVIDDSADATSRTVTFSSSVIQGLAPGTINYVSADTESVTLDGGTGGNKFAIQSAGAGLNTVINGGTGSDLFDITPVAIGTNLTVNGQAPTTTPGDKIVYAGIGANNPGVTGSGTISQPGQASVTYSGIETVIIGADPSQSTVTVLPSSVAAGSETTVTLTARDGLGNPITTGGLVVTFGLGAGAAQGTFSPVFDNNNGTYTASFTASTAGTNTITAMIGSNPVTTTLPTVTVTPGPVSLAESTVTLNPANVAIGSTTIVTLQAEDAYGNDLKTGGLGVEFTLVGGGAGNGTFGPVTDNGNGTYTASFLGTVLGHNTIGATINGQAVVSTGAVSVTAGPVSPAQSFVTVSPASIASGSSTTVTLQARDANDNDEQTGGLSVVFGLGAGAAGGLFGPVTDNNNGTYTATFTGGAEGTNTIAASIGGLPVTFAAPTITVTQGPVSLAQSIVVVTPASVQAGGATTVTLDARDANGVNEPTGGLNVSFGLGAGAASGSFGAVTDNGNGTYSATFTGTIAGAVAVTATIGGQPVTSTPPMVTVTPGPVSISHSTITVNPSTIQVNSTATLTVTLRDAYGNQETTGGSNVVVAQGQVPGIPGTLGGVVDNDNGTYTITFTAGTSVGTTTFVGSANGGPNFTSFAPTLTVVAGAPSPAQSTLTVSPGSIASGGSATVTLTTRDAFGNPDLVGGASVTFGLGSGAATGTFSGVTDNGNGTYTATFTGALDGSNTVTATIGGQLLTSTLPSITVTPGPVSLAKSIVTIAPASVQAGSTTTVTLHARDAAGNAETSGGLIVSFGVGAGAGAGTFSAVTDHGNGLYTATFTGTLAGSNTIIGSIAGQPLTAAAPNFTVTPGPLSLAESNVTLAPSTIAAGTTTTVTLTARDGYGNQEPSGGLTVAFTLGAGAVTGSFGPVTDNSNGTYTAVFTTGGILGASTISATIGANPITSFAPTLTVIPGAVSLAQSTVSVVPGSVASGSTTTVTLVAKDAFGNPETSGGLAVGFSLGAGGGATGAFSGTTDNGNGTYSATFTGVLTGTSTIVATIGGQTVTSTPVATITVTPGPVSLAQSLISIVPATLQAGATAQVTLQARDAAGNDETLGGLNVSFGVGIGAANGTFSAVTDNFNGTYSATFTATTAGTNTITATIGGFNVTSAGPAISITPGPLSLATSAVTLNPATIPAGGTTTVTLTAEDAYGNTLPTGGLLVAFNLGSGNIGGSFGPISDNLNGTYTAVFTAGTTVGANTITATIDGDAIGSTPPTLTVTPAAVSLSQSTFSVVPPSLESGSTASVTLVARDRFGNQEDSGGLNVGLGLGVGAATATFGATTDNGDGTYTAILTGVLVGANTVTATINGQNVSSTLPTITITPGPASTAESFVTVAPASIQAGTQTTVTLHAIDAAGNAETSGGLNVAFGLGVGAATGTFGATIDHGDGTYSAVFTGDLAGTNTITATIGGQAVTAAAPTLAITPAPVNLRESIVTLQPSTVAAGALTTVTLIARDSFGNQETSGGLNVAFALGVGNVTGSFGPVSDNGNGTYSATFSAGGVIGSSTVTATIGGQSLFSAAPTLTVIPGPFSVSESTVTIQPGSLASGSTATVTLIARDRFGNQEAGGGLSVMFGLGAGAATGSFGTTIDHGTGVYTATFTGVLAGTNVVTAAIDGQAIDSAQPALTVTPGPVSAAQSVINVLPASIPVGATASVTLQAEDAAGNLETTGGMHVVFSLGVGTATGTISSTIDGGTGLYSATFTGATTGASTVSATINGVTVTSHLPVITVAPGLTGTQVTATTAPADSSVFGQLVTITATVAPMIAGFGTPSGTVDFYDGPNLIGPATLNGAGVATISDSGLSVAGHTITASYVGSTQYAASTGTLTYTVGKASTAVAVTASTGAVAVFGQSVTFTAVVSAVSPGAGTPADGDLVRFFDGNAAIGVGTLQNGVATFTTSNLIEGRHAISAAFNGDGNFAASTATLDNIAINNFTVSAAGIAASLATSLAVAAVGQPVTFTASIVAVGPSSAIVNTGFVQFLDGTTPLNGLAGTAVANGTATFTTGSIPAGTQSITAFYLPNPEFNGGTSSPPLVEQIYQISAIGVASSAPAGSVFGQSVTFTATLQAANLGAASLNGGVVAFKAGKTILGTGTLSGSGTLYTATYTTSTSPTVQLGVGANAITAVYGAANISSAAAIQNVSKASTQLTLAIPGTSYFDQSVTFTASVAPEAASSAAPTGVVTFKDGAKVLANVALDASGTATFTTSNLAVGTHSISAAYAGAAGFTGSAAPAQGQAVSIAGTTTTIVASSDSQAVLGERVTFTAVVAAQGGGVPTGTVTFMLGNAVLGKGTLNASGVATYTTTTTQLPLGGATITAVYAGAKPGFTGSTSSTFGQAVNDSSTVTSLAASPSNWAVGTPITFTATVTTPTGVPANGGAVTIVDGNGNTLGTANVVNGKAVLHFAGFTSVGAQAVAAGYSGTPGFMSSVSNALSEVIVEIIASAAANTVTVNTPVNLLFDVVGAYGVPTGSLDVYDGKKLLGIIYLNAIGTASLKVSNLAIGTHDITAVYSGDPVDNAGAMPTPIQVVVTPSVPTRFI